MRLPDYSGPPISTRPPFQFSNVVVSCFPLRARIDTLQRFIDGYLNVIPPELGYFRVALPYVNLMLLDYGKLSAQATNFGWFSQREVVFAVSLEWYKWVDGRWLFYSFANVSPFLYVDAEMSMTLGRTAMGWPKSLVSLSPGLTGWIGDPGGTTVDLALSARVFDSAYAGARMTEQPVLKVHSPMAASFRQPFDTDAAFTPWTAWANLARSSVALGGDMLSSLRGLGLLPPHEGSTLENTLRKASSMLTQSAQLLPWAPSLRTSSVNLKQFRRASDPQKFCFQAVTEGPLTVTSLNRGGRLGSPWGDPSGGYMIELACWPNFPIVESLGLDAEFLTAATGPDIARLRPVFPLWYDCNMEYGQTATIAWRTAVDPNADGAPTGHWHGRQGETYAPESADERPYFNTVSGASSPVVTGPFKFPAATATVYPLLARHAALQAALDHTFNVPLEGSGERFEVWGEGADACAYVYLTVVDAGQVTSESNNIGDWGDLSLTLYVPVKRLVHGELVGAGLVPSYAFASGTTQACTLSELYGVPAIETEFTRLAYEWDDVAGDQARPLLRVEAQSLPALNEGQQAKVGVLLELADRGAGAELEHAPLSPMAERYCRLLRAEVERKNAVAAHDKRVGRTRALELLTLRIPLHVYTMKQFRDAGTPEKACYQALVQIPYTVEALHQLEEIERPCSVELRERASFPIASQLGLVARDERHEGGTIVHSLFAVRPFRLRAALHLGNGHELWSRAGETWFAHEPPASSTARVALDTELEEQVSRHRYTHLESAVDDWLERHGSAGAPVDLFRAHRTLDAQSILESVLSREWEDRSSTSSRAGVRQRIVRTLSRDEAGWGSWLHDNLQALSVFRQSDATLVRWLQRLEYVSLVFDREKQRVREMPQAIDASALTQAFVELSEPEWLHAYAEGNANPLDDMTDEQHEQFERLRASCDRVARTYELHELAHPDSLADLSGLARTLLRFLYPFAERRIASAIDEAAERLQKPDHCVLRATAGREKDRLFPLERSWDAAWYDGRLHP